MIIPKGTEPEVADRASIVIQLAQNTDAIHAVDILTPWARENTELFVKVLLAIAAMADPERQLKDAHAAYSRGDRTPIVVELERRYQFQRKRKAREYRRHQEGGAA